MADTTSKISPQERRGRIPFRQLTLNDLHFIRDAAGTHLSSDINPLGLWGYSSDDNEIALIDKNRIVALKIRDYITGNSFYTLVGSDAGDESNTRISNIARYLIHLAPRKGIAPELRLITKDIALRLSEDPSFNIKTDPDNFDYIYDVDQQAALEGREFHGLRNHVNRFKKDHPQVKTKILTLGDRGDADQILDLFDKWGQGKKPEDLVHERAALSRTIRDFEYFKDILTIGFIDPTDSDRLVAFIISDIADKRNKVSDSSLAFAHFAKADTKNYNGIYQALYNQLAIALKARGIKYLNNEQDMGIEGLRRSKTQMRPAWLDEKYTITLN